LSIRAFCWQHGVAVSTIGLWRKRLNHEQQSPVDRGHGIHRRGNGCGAECPSCERPSTIEVT